jgi:hypothetical protein
MLLAAPPTAGAQGVDKDRVDRVARWGVDYLRKNQAARGYWPYNPAIGPEEDHNVGSSALVGLALLESGVDINDRMLVDCAAYVRKHVPKLESTYAISLAILFLDRYRGGKDPELVRMLAMRLAAGQSQSDFGWTYQCPVLNQQQYANMLKILDRDKNKKNFGAPQLNGGNSDNSNAQFAILALWVARNHGIPVNSCLLKAEARFRHSQFENGGWTYGLAAGGLNTETTASMTCAGLLGIAIAHGAKREQEASLRATANDLDTGAKEVANSRTALNNDKAVQRACTFIAEAMKNHQSKPIFHYLYFLWSLERVSVTYGFEDYGGIPWYAYGCNVLFNSQQKDGSWRIENNENVDTAFALLFLNRANLVGDIHGTANLRAGGADPLKAASGPTTAKKPDEKPMKEITKDKAEGEAKRLKGEMLTAKAARQEEILETLRDTKDSTGHFTQTLADLIPMLKDRMQNEARAALAERLSRQSVESLRGRLEDEDGEFRLAAVRAMGLKGDRKAIPDLIKLLANSNEDLAAAAEQSLEAITEKKFGRNQQRWTEFYNTLPKIR